MKRINEFGQGGEGDGPPADGEDDKKDPKVAENESEPPSLSVGGTTRAHSTAASVQVKKGKVTKRLVT